MQIKDFLEKVCNEIRYKPIRKEISEELENHIEEAKEEYMHKGKSEEEAINRAIDDMGDAEIIGKTLNKIHRLAENLEKGYEDGVIIEVLGIEVYNNVKWQ